MMLVVEGALKRRYDWAQRVGEDVYSSYWVAS
jgi:hypothetical protein